MRLAAPKTPPPSTDDPSKKGTRGKSGKPEERPPWWVLAVLLGAAVILVALHGRSVDSNPLLLIELLLAVAAFSSGALLGFLFGLPKASLPRSDTQTDDTAAEAVTQARRQYLPSTNLEQISDWLTKILIGVGLVQLEDLGAGLGNIGSLVSEAVGGSDQARVVTQVVIVCFVIVGFLSSYLWTRLHFGGIQTRTDLAIDDLLQRLAAKTAGLEDKVKAQSTVTEGLRQTTNAMARGELKSTGPAVAGPHPSAVPLPATQHSNLADKWPADVVKGLQRLTDAPPDWNADDVAEHFPNRTSESNGRVLEGEIIADLGGGLVIRLIVRRVSGPPLEGEVIFLLHSTFPDRVLVAPVRDDRAEATIYAAGWFTVAAVMDGGRTVLTYDLRKLPNAPQWFTEDQSMPETGHGKGRDS